MGFFRMTEYYGPSRAGQWNPWLEAPANTGIYMVDPSTCFQDFAKLTPAAVGQPLRVITDLMGNQPDFVLQTDPTGVPNLAQDANGYYLPFSGVEWFSVTSLSPSFGHPSEGILVAADTPRNGTFYGGVGGAQRVYAGTVNTILSWATPLQRAGGFSDGAEHAGSFQHNGLGSLIRVDGSQLGTAGDSGTASSTTLWMGVRAGGSNPLTGRIRYLQVLPGALNTATYRQQVEQWLKARYGTP